MTSGLRFLRIIRATAIAMMAFTFLWLGVVASPATQAGRLSDATSPYLLLHANDAIDWHPWAGDAKGQSPRGIGVFQKRFTPSTGRVRCNP